MWGLSAFLAGAVAASTVWVVLLRLLLDTHRAARGPSVEDRTRALVDVVPQWLAAHDVPVDGGRIDHVVVTPLAVLAVETVWWGQASAAVHEERLEAAIAQAERNARTLKRLLASRDLGFELPVWPVVMAWGPGAEPTRLGGVDVVAGEAAHAWIAAYQTGAIHVGVAAAVHAALLGHQARRDQRCLAA